MLLSPTDDGGDHNITPEISSHPLPTVKRQRLVSDSADGIDADTSDSRREHRASVWEPLPASSTVNKLDNNVVQLAVLDLEQSTTPTRQLDTVAAVNVADVPGTNGDVVLHGSAFPGTNEELRVALAARDVEIADLKRRIDNLWLQVRLI